MTLLAEKLKDAGHDIWGSRIDVLIFEGIRLYPHSVVDVWRYVGEQAGYERIRMLMKDMLGDEKEQKSPPTPLSKDNHFIGGEGKPYKLRQEKSSERKTRIELVASKYKNSGGISWDRVGWHELPGLARDGKEASALLEAGPANLPNDGSTVGDVLGIKRTDEIIASVRASC